MNGRGTAFSAALFATTVIIPYMSRSRMPQLSKGMAVVAPLNQCSPLSNLNKVQYETRTFNREFVYAQDRTNVRERYRTFTETAAEDLTLELEVRWQREFPLISHWYLPPSIADASGDQPRSFLPSVDSLVEHTGIRLALDPLVQ